MFFKNKLSGKDFAEGLVFKVSRDIYDNWHIIQDRLTESLGENDAQHDKISEGYAPFTIVAAVIIDMQAIRNIRSENEFITLRKHVLNRLGDALGNEDVEELFDIYQTSWDQALERNENPLTYGVASVLYDELEISHLLDADRVFQSPQVLKVLSDFILPMTGFTKFA